MVSTHPVVTQAIEIIMRQHACAAHTAAKILNARAVRSHTPMQLLASTIVAEAAAAQPVTAGTAAAVAHPGVAPAQVAATAIGSGQVVDQGPDAAGATDTSLAVAIIMQESACDAAAATAELQARAASHGLTAAEVAGAIVRLGGRQSVS